MLSGDPLKMGWMCEPRHNRALPLGHCPLTGNLTRAHSLTPAGMRTPTHTLTFPHTPTHTLTFTYMHTLSPTGTREHKDPLLLSTSPNSARTCV